MKKLPLNILFGVIITIMYTLVLWLTNAVANAAVSLSEWNEVGRGVTAFFWGVGLIVLWILVFSQRDDIEDFMSKD